VRTCGAAQRLFCNFDLGLAVSTLRRTVLFVVYTHQSARIDLTEFAARPGKRYSRAQRFWHHLPGDWPPPRIPHPIHPQKGEQKCKTTRLPCGLGLRLWGWFLNPFRRFSPSGCLPLCVARGLYGRVFPVRFHFFFLNLDFSYGQFC
jgi:hypothetical protein